MEYEQKYYYVLTTSLVDNINKHSFDTPLRNFKIFRSEERALEEIEKSKKEFEKINENFYSEHKQENGTLLITIDGGYITFEITKAKIYD